MGYMALFFQHWEEPHRAFLNLIKQIPDNLLDFRPTPENFTLREQLTHIIDNEKIFTNAARTGDLSMEDFTILASPPLATVNDIYKYAREVHENTRQQFYMKSDEDLARAVKTPWGDKSIYSLLLMAYDQLMHHRGQVYIYLRLNGITPVFMYDYQEVREEVVV